MAREIKFRAKNVMNGEWVCGDLVHYNHSHTHISIAEKECKEQYFVHPETIGQFTGLQDSKGNDIYEGDIVKRKCVNDGWPTNEGNWPVVFKNGSFGIEVGGSAHIRFAEKEVWADMSASGENIYEYEIIGNIYDNPELLKEEKQ